MDEIMALLEEQYKDTLHEVAIIAEGTEEAKWNLAKLKKLHEELMYEKKFEAEQEIQKKTLEVEERKLQVEELKLANSKWDRLIDVTLGVLGIAVPTATSCYWMAKGLKFEETGSFTSRTGSWISGNKRLFGK